MSEKIIYVVGADFSGTTLLDLMLGSSANAASVGELAAFVSPTAPNHKTPVCSCHTPCGLWSRERTKKTDPYEFLFKFHRVNTLIDSSKQPLWLVKQMKAANKTNREVFVVLIWKTALAYSVSCAKRNNPTGWASKWLRYHRAILQTDAPIYSISLEQLVSDPSSSLQGICKWTGLDYKPEMADYQNHSHHIVFGSATARQTLHEYGTEAWKFERQSSYRSDFHNQLTPEPVSATADQNSSIIQIQNILRADGVKPGNQLPGKKYLIAAIVRKYFEMLAYYLGFNPGTLAKLLHKTFVIIAGSDRR